MDAGDVDVVNHETCLNSFIDIGTEKSHRYFLARRTVLEMLRDRGYNVTQSELNQSLTEFRAVFGEDPEVDRLRISAPLVSDPAKKILVIFLGAAEINVASMRNILGQIVNKDSLQGIMLILQTKLSSYTRKEIAAYPLKVEMFQITELLVNITKHMLMPKYEKLTDAEKQRMMTKYKTTQDDKQFPCMLENDPIARYHGLQKGQMVKLSYNQGIANSLVIYRCVV